MAVFSNDPFKPLTEVERAFAAAKHKAITEELAQPFYQPEGAREQLSASPSAPAALYVHHGGACSHATYSEEFMRRLFRNVMLRN